MKRSGFAPKHAPRPARQWEGPAPVVDPPRATLRSDGLARMVAPKAAPLRDETYRRWVASLPCAHCGIEGRSQCAHGDSGKGLAIKSSDDTCYPLCADSPGVRGCHSIIGASGAFSRDERRELEARYAQQTRALFVADGLWPASLPRWAETEEGATDLEKATRQ